eukprot:14262-Chlamydomonas_euryale.AAC.2
MPAFSLGQHNGPLPFPRHPSFAGLAHARLPLLHLRVRRQRVLHLGQAIAAAPPVRQRHVHRDVRQRLACAPQHRQNIAAIRLLGRGRQAETGRGGAAPMGT